MIRCSIGIMAYNEEENIGKLLDALLHQELSEIEIIEIIVVCSGCTDNTENIVQEFINIDKRIKLISQEEREGKASAVNLFLKSAKGDVCVLESADTLPTSSTVEELVKPFLNSSIGMTGAHPIPVNDPKTFLGFTNHLLWNIHHKLALKHPKLGEMVAFRNIVDSIPIDTAVDEVSIEAKIKEEGYILKYVPSAVVYNKGAENITDFLKQRRRIYAGHLWVKKYYKYTASTMNPFRILLLVISEVKFDFKSIFFTLGAIILEGYGRLLGYIDFYIKKKNPYKWDIAGTTKKLR
jgi:cellulose synthase/poly-beta-1,6-N-acetylglucosamine synthase-like glycosyltransferase